MGLSYGILAGICLYSAGYLHPSYRARKYRSILVPEVATFLLKHKGKSSHRVISEVTKVIMTPNYLGFGDIK
jgi:hypothetical protein